MASPPPNEEAILFRPSKKRKIYRQRTANEEAESEVQAPPAAAVIVGNDAQSLDELIASASGTNADRDGDIDGAEVEGVAVSMSEILRLRRKNKRVGGVEFRALPKLRGDNEEPEMVLHAGEELEGGLDVVSGGPRKFAPQTGAVGDVNKHMMAYIDSELAKRRFEAVSLNEQSQTQSTPLNTTASAPAVAPESGSLGVSGSSRKAQGGDPTITRQPATIGKLQEIDLGDEARSLNVQRTQKAQRMLNGEVVEDEAKGKPVKVRLGPDGKPWRGRKRRGSEDVKRDRAVEDVLRENRLEIYEPPAPVSTSTPGDDGNDDRIAEEFRREFMDAVSQRQRKKTTQVQAPTRSAGGKKEEEVLKGPKLGGSRNARASMRESMLKAAAGGKK